MIIGRARRREWGKKRNVGIQVKIIIRKVKRIITTIKLRFEIRINLERLKIEKVWK